ncbi:dihydroxyacetone kinase family protein [Microbacterium betulae]|uniref:Dihydroxyacetone kinase family protein n=1 Tax=Microbacterium betulae TaxID=2981139 RepID=A0AA97FEY5_9MICO|nr:dihydroxyacetone kinase family protein [Microbacterium sp. AB]WOF22391.1 dihydroxyacetone kinase family protein [Microbacterium sp. AB]
MSYVLNDAERFADEATTGFVAAHRDVVRHVPGGVARATATPPGEVAVVVGGGSGHYPAFAGLVGPGLAHAAALGNVFASPSAQQVHGVARSVATEAGVLLSYGNYAGDVLNFGLAEKRLRDEGVPVRTVRVTDDVSSAGPDERHSRRGIAGDLVVFRTAAWAAERGLPLDDVTDLAFRANDRTRSLGVAFSGCTLPGAAEPLFTVPDGQMGVGIGIHGEPGIDTRPLPTARELAVLFVETLLGERPDDVPAAEGARVGVILNGLGSVKGEELFVVYGAVAELLEAEGLTIVDPEVGEYATSFEMAGISLTLFWLDDDLEQAWTSPAYAAAYRKGAVRPSGPRLDDDARDPVETEDVAPSADGSAEAGRIVSAAIAAVRDVIDRDADELGRLDAIAGDGDHGIGMQRGARAAAEAAEDAVEAGAGAGTVLVRAGDAWAHRAGGTSGALWGAGLRAAGERLGDGAAPAPADVAEAVHAARATIQGFGGAEIGDKTLVDALVPFAEALAAAVEDDDALAEAWTAAADAATEAARATADLAPRLGRARSHVKRSAGTPDPGAISFARAMTAAGDALARNHEEGT